MIKRIVSKVGKRHRPEIDMMEFIQAEDVIEFDLDRDLFTDKPVVVKKKSITIRKNTQREQTMNTDSVFEIENEQIAEFSEEIENQE